MSLATLLTGCGDGSAVDSAAQAAQAPARTGNRPASQLERSLDAWWRGLSGKSAKNGGAPASATAQQVHIDIAAIAARHPAWKLARALEENRATELNFAAVQSAGVTVPALPSPSFDVSFGESSAPTPPGGALPPAALAGQEYRSEAQTVTAAGLEALQNETADHQSDALENFLRSVGAHQNERRSEYEGILRAGLENEIEQLTAVALPEVTPPLLSSEDQLRVTNLRLRLLRNIFNSDEDRRQARAELNDILSLWQNRIRQQQKERLLELNRVRKEVPEQARSAGEARIQREIEGLRRQDRAARIAILREHRLRVLQDFSGDITRLAITLPAVSAPLPGLEAFSTPTQPGLGLEGNYLIETNSAFRASQPGLGQIAPVRIAGTEGLRTSTGGRDDLVRSLKAQAWRDARVQATMAARRFGWNWQPAQSEGATDRTREAMQWLFG